uniref:SMP domain-containing protein n=1 Tax=Fagus sylvatica TaxID=28930 RepID=A0A2N9GEP6_FAGSY
MVLFLLFFVFVLGLAIGALTILGAEAVGVYVIINRLNHKNRQKEAQIASQPQDLDPHQSLDFASNKQGVVWVLESEKVPRNLVDKGPKEQKKKKDFLEVSPVKKHAKIKDRKLILFESDGSQIAVDLKGCIVEAVSATSLPSRKW